MFVHSGSHCMDHSFTNFSDLFENYEPAPVCESGLVWHSVMSLPESIAIEEDLRAASACDGVFYRGSCFHNKNKTIKQQNFPTMEPSFKRGTSRPKSLIHYPYLLTLIPNPTVCCAKKIVKGPKPNHKPNPGDAGISGRREF